MLKVDANFRKFGDGDKICNLCFKLRAHTVRLQSPMSIKIQSIYGLKVKESNFASVLFFLNALNSILAQIRIFSDYNPFANKGILLLLQKNNVNVDERKRLKRLTVFRAA